MDLAVKTFLLKPKTILWAIFLILFVITVVQNSEPTSFKFLFWSVAQMPKLFLILASMGLGSIVTLIVAWQLRRSKKTSTGEVA